MGIKIIFKLNLREQVKAPIFLSILFSGLLAFSHGEEKLGPNGGFIQMPGAFHTELVPGENENFKIFLLDMNWENPSVKDSSLDAKLVKKNKKTSVKCVIETNYYLCSLEKGMDLKKGKLEIIAQREGMKGNVAVYSLPLKLKESRGGGHHH